MLDANYKYGNYSRMGSYWVMHWHYPAKCKAIEIALVDGSYLYAAYGPDGVLFDTGIAPTWPEARVAAEQLIRKARREADSPQVRHKGAKRRKS